MPIEAARERAVSSAPETKSRPGTLPRMHDQGRKETSLRCLAVDSDGCVFDSMTEKHTRVFTPLLIRTFKLEPIAELARELALDINLYSETRGLNRFAALDLFFERLHARLDAETWSKLQLPDTQPLHDWVAQGGTLSQDKLEVTRREPGGILDQALAWSRAVNENVALLPPAKPFPAAAGILAALSDRLEIRVVSSANSDALEREWSEADLARHVATLGGQEHGTKTEQLRAAAGAHGADGVLMVGDAEGDFVAAQEAGVRFFRIRAGEENASWQELAEQLSNP